MRGFGLRYVLWEPYRVVIATHIELIVCNSEAHCYAHKHLRNLQKGDYAIPLGLVPTACEKKVEVHDGMNTIVH